MYIAVNYNQAINYRNYFNGDGLALYGAAILIILAGSLIGRERTNDSSDFHFSLPFSRKDLFLSKWLFGVGHIVIGLGINILIVIALAETTMINMYERSNHWLLFYLIAVVVLTAIFSFALFLGTITGNIVLQLVLSFVTLIFAHGLTALMEVAQRIHVDRVYGLVTQTEIFSTIITHLQPTYILQEYIVAYDEYSDFSVYSLDLYYLMVPVCVIIFSFLVGMLLYTRTKSENNGKALLFPVLHLPFIVCTVICFALFGGYFIATLFNSTLISYYIGFIGAGIGTFFFLRKIITLKLKSQMR